LVGDAVAIVVVTLSGLREVSELVDCVVCAAVVDEVLVVLEVLVLLVVLVVGGSCGVDVVEVDEVVEDVEVGSDAVVGIGVCSAVVWAGVPPLALALVGAACPVPIKSLIDRLIAIERQL
jgi:TusA-related sulfurtransferase